MSRYLCIFAGIFAVAAASATYAPPASAICAKVISGEVSSWKEKVFLFGCKKKLLGTSQYTKVTGVGKEVGVGTGVACYHVGNTDEESMWSNTGCTTLKAGKGEFIKVEVDTVELVACGVAEEGEGEVAVRRDVSTKKVSMKEQIFARIPSLEVDFA